MPNKKQTSIWKNAKVVKPRDLGATKIHVTLRLDPKLYRQILLEQKKENERTVTATIERILRLSLDDSRIEDYIRVVATIRNILAHSMLQDEILSGMVGPNSAKFDIGRLLTERDKLKNQSDMLADLLRSVNEQKLPA